jgi:hypothetical protein
MAGSPGGWRRVAVAENGLTGRGESAHLSHAPMAAAGTSVYPVQSLSTIKEDDEFNKAKSSHRVFSALLLVTEFMHQPATVWDCSAGCLGSAFQLTAG